MPISVISTAQMREWEAATWATGQTEAEVIRRVGKRVARRARKMSEYGSQLREKQRLRRQFGMQEVQFKRFFR